MRIGANIDLNPGDPAQWIEMLQSIQARAAVAPINCAADGEERRAYRKAAAENDIVIAEVGVWNNPLDPDDEARRSAVAYAKGQLALAEELGARCCVNVAGARGPVWDGAYAENRSKDAYALIVDTVREIIDAVRPTRTFYTLEPVGWMFPAAPEENLDLLRDVGRAAFGVHLDYTNMITGVSQYMNRAEYIRYCYRTLAPYVRSVHAKDIRLMPGTPCCIREVPPGQGEIDFAEVLRLTEALPDMPLLVEHLSTLDECREATAHLYAVARREGIAC